MLLMRGRILGYDKGRMAFRFSMLNGGEEVDCQISAAAIDELTGGPRARVGSREAQFAQLREVIETLASAKFEKDAVSRAGVVRIFAKDITKATRDDLRQRTLPVRPTLVPATSITPARGEGW